MSVRDRSTHALDQRVLLADGSPVDVRPLDAADAAALTRLHRDLPAHDRWLRFATVAPQGLEDYAAGAVSAQQVWGAYVGAELVGAVHLAPVGDDPEEAEVGVTVSHRMQAHGVGTALLERAARESARRGVRRWTAEVLTENAPMLRVFADLGLPVSRHLDGPVVHLTATLPDADDAGEAFATAALARTAHAARAGLAPVLRPRSIAVIGASRRLGSVGRAVLDALVAGHYAGALHVVHPHASVIAGVPAVSSVDLLPAAPDLVVLATPPDTLPELVEASGRRGTRAVLVLTSGLAAAGVDGAVLDAVRRHGMRMVGPNCLGAVNTEADVRLDATFAPSRAPRGPVGVVAQSGGVAIAVLEALRGLGLGVSTLVSVGDRYDVSSNDLLAWWSEDTATEFAVLHVESFGNPRAFSRLARRLSARVPVLAVRAANSEVGARAAASHTAASATPAVRRDALYRQAGVQPVDDLGELAGALAALAWSPPAPGDRVAVLGNAGGTNVLAADALVAAGLRVPPLTRSTRERLDALLPATAATAGPVDTTAAVDAETFGACLAVLRDAEEVDAVLAVSCPTALGDPGTGLVRVLARPARRAVPVVAVALDQRPRTAAVSDPAGLPRAASFADPADAAQALAHLVRRGADVARDPGRPLSAEDHPVDLAAARAAVTAALDRSPEGGWLDPDACAALLGAAGLDLLAGRTTRTVEEAVTAARDTGGPVALKVVADGVLHKSEQGGVALGVRGDAAVRETVEGFAARFGEAWRGTVVQPMAPPGVEMLVGVAGDPDFGALVTAGVGGTGTDVADRRWHRLVPMTTVDLDEFLDELPLDRGIAARLVDRDLLAVVIARVARLAELVPQIAEMDLNPVVCTPDACRLVDARVRVGPVLTR
ncbi:bifunctional GNAT family N-acetyltransferase/acetate--CoA ligase family protein [Actinomycetospora cinnamomea]|uniref:Acyl-CoA synthetase (NDP forming) n=1 Tax=Actinomycetospora cinnamomea TaxID=663609 RepID=A0A2U1F274_9PSEU|nr:GNAT family N-acetyltransferase [Actinomycetospora cinnamomea]PVZ06268.1 acyl-CoA synthetase (NDP forming) [Actinomycetospora cinnamomea]